MAESIYSTTMISNGGRDGRVFSPDNTFVQNLATPKEMGGQGGNDTNPEQLFAAGYSACFNSALSLILSRHKVNDANPEVEITIELVKDATDNGFKLAADIEVTLENVSQEEAEQYVEQAHQFCPYSKATRGNIDVNLKANAQ
ncbi:MULTISPECIES: organic hydroperoxide resistance protein [Staphylococcus]|uniref:Organic hydroperoxide resistance protein n=1 Tax=Staphylococcus warneri TaxID=1292 RepID=A0A2T4Q2Z1_STAWA|nr:MULTISPECIES: organic hydroperoxide resistance protein [Staphylococcus]MBE9429592.1 organic hydroperoxide resistance protein [Staphylococcus epidermidis]MBY6179898.1 organic hydroperoxide resistance protein [Staphylococcaceae bacterium DP2N0-1]AXV41339.1 osmotically inducible protein OsmC [Staphylococcus sp. M0911]MBO0376762.1 organic hydroperoxide resistance protein [Staphylococcus warneri]MDK4214018.1 organic hydroperoxide resistance protein [Staphylococcus warneri]